MTKIHPVAGYLLVEPQQKEKTTASGIYLPENNQDKPQQGKVIAVGDSIFINDREVVCPCKIGDTVFYKEWGTNEIKDNDEKLFLIKFDDIMAIIK